MERPASTTRQRRKAARHCRPCTRSLRSSPEKHFKSFATMNHEPLAHDRNDSHSGSPLEGTGRIPETRAYLLRRAGRSPGLLPHRVRRTAPLADDRSYSDLVALCQFLPGPASSQVGIALGLGRAGWLGALAAWVGFTLPSAVALILFAFGVAEWSGLASSSVVHGLKVVAVAVVAQAVLGMAKSLCPDRLRAGLAVVAALGVLAVPNALGQVAVIALGGLWGGSLCASTNSSQQATATTGCRSPLAQPSWWCSAGCSCCCRSLPPPRAPRWRRRSRSSTRPAHWCSGVDTSFCPFSSPAWFPQAGSTTTRSWPATGPLRPCQGRCSPSRPTWAQRCMRHLADGPAA
jgi:chromate transport protein ChrA